MQRSQGPIFTVILLTVTTSACTAETAAPDALPSISSSPAVRATPSARPTAETPAGFSIPDSCLDVVGKEHRDLFASQGMTLVEGPGSGGSGAFDRFPVEAELTDIWCIWATPSFDASVEIDIGPISPEVRQSVVDWLAIQYMTITTEGEVVRYEMNNNFGLDLPARVDLLGLDSWITVHVHPGGPAPFELTKALAAEVAANTNAG